MALCLPKGSLSVSNSLALSLHPTFEALFLRHKQLGLGSKQESLCLVNDAAPSADTGNLDFNTETFQTGQMSKYHFLLLVTQPIW